MADRVAQWSMPYKGLIIGVTSDDSRLFEPFTVGQTVFPDDMILESILIPGPGGFQGSKYANLLRKWKAHIVHPNDERINPEDFPMSFHAERFALKGQNYVAGVVHDINLDGLDGAVIEGGDLSILEQKSFTADRIMSLLRDAVDFRNAKIQSMNADSLFVTERMEMVD